MGTDYSVSFSLSRISRHPSATDEKIANEVLNSYEAIFCWQELQPTDRWDWTECLKALCSALKPGLSVDLLIVPSSSGAIKEQHWESNTGLFLYEKVIDSPSRFSADLLRGYRLKRAQEQEAQQKARSEACAALRAKEELAQQALSKLTLDERKALGIA